MRRACKVTLKFATSSKRDSIDALLEAYRAAVNFYIRSLWTERGKLNAATLARLPDSRTRLSARYKSQALKQALETVVFTRKAAKETGRPCSLPLFHGSAVLDSKFVSVEVGQGSFDLVARLSSLRKGKKITIPTRSTAVLAKWLSKPGARLVQGCALSENSLVLWVEIPDEPCRTDEPAMGADIGINKLLSLSDGTHLGNGFKEVAAKVRRTVPGSKGRKRALVARDNYIRQQVKLIPWSDISLLGVEALKDLKRGKSKNRGKTFRKAVSPWTYSRVLGELRNKAQENRVRLVAVAPAYTSQTCPLCERADKRSRSGEKFTCTHCAFSGDADTVGAVNILRRALRLAGSLDSPVQGNPFGLVWTRR